MADMKNSSEFHVLESPLTITRKIEAYVAKGAIDEERRSQKALLLLKARDQQIALLERRVLQLENAAAEMHALTLQGQISTLAEPSDKTSYFSIPDYRGVVLTSESQEEVTTNNKRRTKSPVRVPELNLSDSPKSDSENDVFSTPVSSGVDEDKNGEDERTLRKAESTGLSGEDTVYLLRDESLGNFESCSKRQQTSSVDILQRGDGASRRRKIEDVFKKNSAEEAVKETDANSGPITCNLNLDNKILSEISGNIFKSRDRGSLTLLMAAAAILKSNEKIVQSQEVEELKKVRGDDPESKGSSNVNFSKLESSRSVKQLSPSIPWVRTKRRLRRKSRGHEPTVGFVTRQEMVGGKDVRRQKIGFQSTSRSLPAVNSVFLESKKTSRTGDRGGADLKNSQNGDAVSRSVNDFGKTEQYRETSESETADPVRIISETVAEFKFPVVSNRNKKISSNVDTLSGHPITSKVEITTADDEPAPQWLIEEALRHEKKSNVVNRYDTVNRVPEETGNEISSLKAKYEGIISDLETQLNGMKIELGIAQKKRSSLKEKFKRAVQNARMEGVRENEILQEKIVRICSSVLEKFGPYAFGEKKENCSHRAKNRRVFKHHRQTCKKLRRKLRSALVGSGKLKEELCKTKEIVAEKSRRYDSLDKKFSRLKQELETTELNLNDLISENSSLRKKFQDTREWMELKIGKDRHERNNLMQLKDMQKSRDIINLKKKTDEDFATITQLRNKLLRSESANANKGFLLNSYKSQLTDMMKERDQSVSKNKELENELTQLRNTNAQLKAKISLLTNDKEKLISGKKSGSDSKDEREHSMLNEIETTRLKCDVLLEDMRDRMTSAENSSSEYSAAILEFLRRLTDRFEEPEDETVPIDDDEAHKTACTILNMTPKELSGFMKGPETDKISACIADFRKITSRKSFSASLANFLFEKITS